MARKELVAKGPLRYGTRMLQAGDPLVLDGPKARLYEALGLAEEPADEEQAERDPADTDAAPQPTKRKRKARKTK